MYAHLLMKRSRKRSNEAVLLRERAVSRHRKIFEKRQAQQRLAFQFIMSIATLHIQSPIRAVWSN